MPTPYRAQFRQDAIDVAREAEAPMTQIATDFGLSSTMPNRWTPVPDVGIRCWQRQWGVGRDAGAEEAEACWKSFFSLLQKKVLDRRRWLTRQDLRLAITTWIVRTYHRRPRQRRLGNLSHRILNNQSDRAHCA